MPSLTKYKFWIGGIFCLAALGLVFAATRTKGPPAPPSAPTEVEVVQVHQQDVPIYGEWIGTLDGFSTADVRAQVAGYLLRQGHQEGTFVRKGQLLFEINPRPFKAALEVCQR